MRSDDEQQPAPFDAGAPVPGLGFDREIWRGMAGALLHGPEVYPFVGIPNRCMGQAMTDSEKACGNNAA